MYLLMTVTITLTLTRKVFFARENMFPIASSLISNLGTNQDEMPEFVTARRNSELLGSSVWVGFHPAKILRDAFIPSSRLVLAIGCQK